MSLEDIAILIERENRLHQEWLSALSHLEAHLHSRGPSSTSEVTLFLQEIMQQIEHTQKTIMEEISRYSIQIAAQDTYPSDPLHEHILALHENIELLQQKITQKHHDLRMYHPLQSPSSSAAPVQLALDHSMDLLKHLVNLQR